ncbi:MAG: ABC transporter ATP-binding protein [Hungatella sp.]|nr:ABC transporter ATP-binding protein [Hungatella sp.]
MNLEICNLTKSFGEHTVLKGVSLIFEEGKTYCVMSPSGSGKTTLFRIIIGLEQADKGEIKGIKGKRFGAVFQEDRLCEAYSPLDNVMMTADRQVTRETAARELCRLLPEESITRPVCTLSGGMKRRTAICRALLAFWDILLMDEPFTGLDDATRKEVISYVREKTAGRLVILSTHQQEDVEALGARLVRL